MTLPASGTLVINADGTFDYTPEPGFIGEVSFEYEITDPSGATSTAIATINVRPDDDPFGNDNPDANDDAVTTQVNTCLLYTSPSPRDKRQSRMPSSA